MNFLLSNEVKSFLNNLDTHIPSLLNDKASKIIRANILDELNGILLYANEYAILNRIAQYVVKHVFNIETLHIRPAFFDKNDNAVSNQEYDYLLSDVHMEFELNEKSLAYIKSIITNRTISNKSFVFIIKNAECKISRHHFLALRRLMDINSTSKFIITSTSMGFMESSLTSRLLPINCSFPFSNIINLRSSEIIPSCISEDELHCRYSKAKDNIISLLQNINFDVEKELLWEKAVNKVLLSFTTEKKQYNIIKNIRELVYKLFHVGVSIKDICMYVIKKYNTHKKINDIVIELARYEHETLIGAKEILVYEKIFLYLYKITTS
jgi:hypothetical protein